MGGDEFVVFLPEEGSRQAIMASERIRIAMENIPLEISGRNIFTTISIGIASYPEHGATLQEIMKNADRALYISKKKGRNKSTVFFDQ